MGTRAMSAEEAQDGAAAVPEQAVPTTDDLSRKRPLDEGAVEGDAKRPAYGDTIDETALKVLVPNAEAGSVIGKGGSVINQIQNDSTARVKMSQNGDFFPGTMDRVVLITGTSAAVSQGLAMILNTLTQGKQGVNPADLEQAFEFKIDVPHAA